MTTLHFDHGIAVIIAPTASGGSRSSSERRAVLDIIAHRMGPAARYAHHADGSPYLDGPGMPHISVSHCRGYAAVAFSPQRRVGIDIERPRTRQLQRVATRFLSTAELALFGHDLLRAWTVKEAAYKAATAPSADLRRISLLSLPAISTPAGPLHLAYSGPAGDSLWLSVVYDIS